MGNSLNKLKKMIFRSKCCNDNSMNSYSYEYSKCLIIQCSRCHSQLKLLKTNKNDVEVLGVD